MCEASYLLRVTLTKINRHKSDFKLRVRREKETDSALDIDCHYSNFGIY